MKRFRRTLALLYPTWTDLFSDPYGKTSWALLRAYPHPQLLLNAEPSKVREVMRAAVNGNGLCVRPEKVVEAVAASLDCDIMDQGMSVALQVLMNEIDHLDEQIQQLDTQIQAYWRQVKARTTFWSYPGLTDQQAAALYCEFGDLAKFETGDAAVAYAGLENMVYQSGEKLINGKMSKAGPKLIRRVLYETLFPPGKRLPGITEYMDHLEDKDKHRNVRVHAASKKLIRRMHAMERKQEYYRPC